MNTRIFLAACASLALWSCDDRIANTTSERGTNDETSTFYLADGQKAANASVFVYPLRSTDSLPVAAAYTDANGKLSISNLDRGLYSLVVRSPSGEAVFVDSVFSNGTTASVRNDTLRRTGGLKGKVKVQVQDDPRIAWLYLQGAGIYKNVDDSGSFLLIGVPEGRYTLLARTDRTDYTTTVQSVVVHPDSVVDVGAIELVYTGLPVVTGIVGIWDSLGGTVAVHWDPSPSRKVKGYEIWRGASNDPQVERRLGYLDSATTSWMDTVFPVNHAFEATKAYVRYRVVPVSQDGAPGMAWNSWSDSLRPPFLVATLAAKWTLASSVAPALPTRLDTLSGGLVMLENAGETTAFSVSTDGTNWRRVREEANQPDYTGSNTGASQGVSQGGRYWWVRKVPGTRTAPIAYAGMGGTQTLLDSLRILSLDASGKVDSFTLPASGDSVAGAYLRNDSAGTILVEGLIMGSPVTSQGFVISKYTHFLQADGKLGSGTWASWFPFTANENTGMLEPEFKTRLVSPSGNVQLDPVVTRLGWFNPYRMSEPYQLFLDSLLIGGNGTWYARPGSINYPHRIETPAGIAPSAITWWRGRIWVADSNRVWNVTIPDRLPKSE